MITRHEYSSLMYLRFFVSDFPFSICSGNTFFFSCNGCITNGIVFGHRDSFACRAATHRRAFQESEGALDWTSSDGWPRDRHHY